MTAKFAVFTPLHAPGNAYIEEAWQSLLAQTRTDWHWYVLENNGGVLPAALAADPRVTLVVPTGAVEGVGALKRTLCMTSDEPWLVELDNDDLLHPSALARLAGCFEAGDEFVYSDFAEFTDHGDGRWSPNIYNGAYGWQCYAVEFQEHKLLAMRAPSMTAQNLRSILWAPNHVRAWTREAYMRIGGHNASMPVSDDFDLVVRTYLAGCKWTCVHECLYFYRVHRSNTVAARNAEIQLGAGRVYERSIWALAEKFADDNNLLKVDLCGAIDPPAGYFVLDQDYTGDPDHGVRCDLNAVWPLPANSVGLLRAHDAVEHLPNPIVTMNEAYRVLAPGGFLMISVPSTNGVGAFCDPTHVSYWNAQSFRYYTDQNFARYIPGFKGRFQVSRIIEWFPSAWHKEVNMPYVEAQLIKLGPGYAPMGEVLWPPPYGQQG